jgi:hypothetical protein
MSIHFTENMAERSQNGELVLEVPKMKSAHPDIAFKIKEK